MMCVHGGIYMKKLGLFLLLLAAVGMVNAAATTCGLPTDMGYGLCKTMNNLCWSLTGLLPVIAMLMVVIAGVIYASGQIMGAETRARANVWATAALTGALIAMLIWAVAPGVLQALIPTSSSVNGVSCTTFIP